MGPTEVLVVNDLLGIPDLVHDISTNIPISCSRKISLHSNKQQQQWTHTTC